MHIREIKNPESLRTSGVNAKNENTNGVDFKRFPPYAKRLKPSQLRTIWVCIGSDCWGRANSPTWFPGCKVLMPPGENPCSFKWSFVAGFADVAIIADGEQPGADVITDLVRELLIHSDSVLLLPVDRVPVKFSAQGARRAA